MSADSYQNNLKELSDSKFTIAEGESDIRGWLVKNTQGRLLGKVNDLIFDVKEGKVKYLILDLDGNELYFQVRKVLLPLDIAELDLVSKNVVFPGLMASELTSLPSYERGMISSRYEEIIRNVFYDQVARI